MAKNSSSEKMGYDVFLSFRGSDTRMGFVGFLYKALNEKGGIRTFMDDDKELHKEEIENAKLCIVVFSKNYAESSLCLDKLVCIFNSIKLIFPVFYDVDSSELHNQKGIYGKALAMHEKIIDSKRVHKWRQALQQAAHLSSTFDFKLGDGYEYELIDKIVNMVSATIGSSPLVVAEQLVGLDYRVKDLEWYLEEKCKSCNGLHILGIHGVGGIGKTTLARALYNSISFRFDASCFLDNVGEKSRKQGLVHLQETLLAHIVEEKDLLPVTVSEGIQLLKDNLRRKKVLVVLDSVDALDQLEATVGGGRDMFGFGSLVIITTRDKSLLVSHEIKRQYEVNGLTDDEALELLCWKAFKTDKVHIDFIDNLYRAINCASGNPLALEVIGSNMYGKGLEEWDSTLPLYEQIHHMGIQMILKQTYDALDELEKQVFLDIACFFKDYQITEVEYILGAHHDLCLKTQISSLVQKSLIKINEHGCVTMHDLLRDMGKDIVRQQSPEDPGKRSRLWSTQDIVQVLQQNLGTSEIEIIILDSPKLEEVVKWDGKAFMNMKCLRSLIIRDECFLEAPKHLPNSLRVLEWWGYPSQSLPPDFYPKKLNILKLPYSCFSLQPSKFELIRTPQKFVDMEILNLDKCEFIMHIPDVSGAPNLKKLSFSCCENLVSIHESVGYLNKLISLNGEGCSRLRNFPPIKLTSLEYFNLSYCSNLVSFPEILGNMEHLTHLLLEYTAISELPYSMKNLTRLQSLELRGCGILQLPSTIVVLQELEELTISRCEGLQYSNKEDKKVGNVTSKVSTYSNVKHVDFLRCNLSDEFIEVGLTLFTNVKELDLSMNNFTILPAYIQEFRFLTKLRLDYCMHLQEIGGIPPNLETFSAIRCTSLKYLDLTVLASNKEGCFLRELIVDECENLQEIRGTPPSIVLFSARNCRSLNASSIGLLLNQELHEAGNKRFCLPGSQMPQWFNHFSKGHSISFWFHNKFPAISICLVGPMHRLPIKLSPTVIINGTKMETEFQTQKVFYFEFPLITDHILIFDIPDVKMNENVNEVLSQDEWNHVVVSIDVDFKLDPTEPFVVQTGLHVIEQKGSMDDIQFTNPYSQLAEMRISRRSQLMQLHEQLD